MAEHDDFLKRVQILDTAAKRAAALAEAAMFDGMDVMLNQLEHDFTALQNDAAVAGFTLSADAGIRDLLEGLIDRMATIDCILAGAAVLDSDAATEVPVQARRLH